MGLLRYIVGLGLLLAMAACQLQKPAPQVSLQATLPTAEEQCADGEMIRIFVPRPDPDMEARKWMTYIQMHFALTALTPVDLILDPAYRDEDANTAVPQGQILVPCAAVWGPARPALRAWADKPRYIDGMAYLKKDVFKGGLYASARNHARRQRIPERLDDFLRRLTGERGGLRFGDWNKVTLARQGFQFSLAEPSRAKARARALFVRPAQANKPHLSIALTLEPRYLPEDQAAIDDLKVLEVELIVGRDRGATQHHDFYAYDHDGKLTNCSVFFSGKRLVRGPVPHSCMGCHADYEAKAMQPAPKSFVGKPIANWNVPELALAKLESSMIDSCSDTVSGGLGILESDMVD